MKSYLSKSVLGRWLAAILLTGAVVTSSGCIAVAAAGAAGAGVAWYSGKLESNLTDDLDAVFRASQEALADLEFAKISDQKTAIDAQLVSRTALDKKVEITLQKLSDDSTKVSIRVGLLGDESLSMAILDKIKANL